MPSILVGKSWNLSQTFSFAISFNPPRFDFAFSARSELCPHANTQTHSRTFTHTFTLTCRTNCVGKLQICVSQNVVYKFARSFSSRRPPLAVCPTKTTVAHTFGVAIVVSSGYQYNQHSKQRAKHIKWRLWLLMGEKESGQRFKKIVSL